MKKSFTHLTELKLTGIQSRTNNSAEANQTTAKIGATVQRYFHQNLPEKMTNRQNSGVTYCVYTDYESDFNGDYTFLIGEQVSSFDDSQADLSNLTIPAQKYAKFTSEPGQMPDVCINMWQKIWALTPEELGGQREYLADFEVYDERANDPEKVILDIYIGIKT